jgi:hypothetical protein
MLAYSISYSVSRESVTNMLASLGSTYFPRSSHGLLDFTSSFSITGFVSITFLPSRCIYSSYRQIVSRFDIRIEVSVVFRLLLSRKSIDHFFPRIKEPWIMSAHERAWNPVVCEEAMDTRNVQLRVL